MRPSTRTLLSTTLLLVSAASAHAALKSGTITGTVTSSGILAPVSVGGTLSGTYTYDDAVTATPIFGTGNPLTAFSLQFAGTSTVFTLADLYNSSNNAGLQAVRLPAGSTSAQDQLGFFFDNSSRSTAINAFVGGSVGSQTIVNNPPGLPQSYEIGAVDTNRSFAFSFTATPSAVPEASSLLLTGGLLGAGGLALRRSRRAKAAPTV